MVFAWVSTRNLLRNKTGRVSARTEGGAISLKGPLSVSVRWPCCLQLTRTGLSPTCSPVTLGSVTWNPHLHFPKHKLVPAHTGLTVEWGGA